LEIARRAYELFEARGGEHGHDREDWFRAESEAVRPISVAASKNEVQISLRASVLGVDHKELNVSVEPRRVMVFGEKARCNQSREWKNRANRLTSRPDNANR
jgi:HSP20 family molecular chaperone IbpA